MISRVRIFFRISAGVRSSSSVERRLGMRSRITAPAVLRRSFDDCLARHTLGFGFVTHDDAMAQDVEADALDVLWRDVAATVEESVSACGEGEIDRGARRGAVSNQAVEFQM